MRIAVNTQIRHCTRHRLQVAALVIALIAGPASRTQTVWAQTKPAEKAPAEASGAAAKPTAAAEDAPAGASDDAARRAECETHIAVLSGRVEDKSAPEKAAIRALGEQVPDLVTCGAVKRDSDDLCRVFVAANGEPKGYVPPGPYRSCRETYSIFHELRAYPKSRAFMVDDVQAQECHAIEATAKSCDPFRAAVRAADGSKCSAAMGPLEPVCRKLTDLKRPLDKTMCAEPGNDFLDKHVQDCVKQVEARAIYDKGIKALAESAASREGMFAKAALKQADACDTFAKRAMELCTAAPAGVSPETGSSKKK